MDTQKPPTKRLIGAQARNPITPNLKREINRICHVRAQRAFYEFRRQMEEEARSLLLDGNAEADVLRCLTEGDEPIRPGARTHAREGIKGEQGR